MAVIILLFLAVLLAIYLKFDIRKLSKIIYLKPFLHKYDKIKNETENADKVLQKHVWDIPGPYILPFLGTKWIFFVFFKKYKMSTLHEVYAGKFPWLLVSNVCQTVFQLH